MWLRGPYCRLCNVTDTSRYYDPTQSACVPCEGGVEAPLAIVISAIVVAAVVIPLWARLKPLRNVPILARVGGWAWRLFSQLALRAKLKQMLAFYQVATRISDVYVIPMPEAVERLPGSKQLSPLTRAAGAAWCVPPCRAAFGSCMRLRI